MTSKELSPANFINIHCHGLSSEKCIYSYNPGINDLAKDTLFSVGLHPWSISTNLIENYQLMSEVHQRAQDKNCLMIGESGLDRLRGASLDLQEEFMREHIKISEDLKKPLILHNVRALDLILKLQRQERPLQPWILHDFNGNDIQIAQISNKNIYVSLGPTFMRENSKISEFVAKVRTERILFETDDDKNLNVKDVYQKYSDLTKISLENLCVQVEKNFTNLFEASA